MIELVTDLNVKEQISSKILCGLPDWFGLTDSIKTYTSESRNMPFWAYFDDGNPAGFIALKETGSKTAEIYVMGVMKEYHRRGIGTMLWNAFCDYAVSAGYEYAQVKTVKKGCYAEYDITNAFYESLGFCELECFPTLWDENNPCQVYVKYISK